MAKPPDKSGFHADRVAFHVLLPRELADRVNAYKTRHSLPTATSALILATSHGMDFLESWSITPESIAEEDKRDA